MPSNENAKSVETSPVSSTPANANQIERPLPTTTSVAIKMLQDLKVTKGSRFNAAERLRQKDRYNTYATAYLSSAVIIVTLCGIMFPFFKKYDDIMNIGTVAFSLLIVVFSLLQYSSNDAVRAELHHRCATELNALRHELEAVLATGTTDLIAFSKRYDEIIQSYGVNHEPVDFERYKLEHPLEYPPQTAKARAAMVKDVSRDGRFPRAVIGALSYALFAVAFGVLVATAVNTVPSLITLLYHVMWPFR